MFPVRMLGKRALVVYGLALRCTPCCSFSYTAGNYFVNQCTNITFERTLFVSARKLIDVTKRQIELRTRRETLGNKCNIDNLLTSIRHNTIHFARVPVADVEYLLRFMKSELVDKDEGAGILLLQCCAHFLPDISPSERVTLADSIWSTLSELGTVLTTDHYNTLLNCYLKAGHKIVPSEFILRMKDVNVNEETYQLLLECVCAVGDTEQAADILQLMKERNLPAGERVFSALIMCYAQHRDLEGIRSVMNTVQSAQLTPSGYIYAALVRSYLEMGEFDKFKKTLTEMKNSNVKLSEPQIISIVKNMAITQQSELIPQFLSSLSEDTLDITSEVYNGIVELVHMRHVKAAYHLLNGVSQKSEFISQQGTPFGTFLITEMCKSDTESSEIIGICKSMKNSGTNPEALHIAAESSLNFRRTELALTLFSILNKEGFEIRPHYFWPIFINKAKQEGENGVFEVLSKMQSLGVEPDWQTLLEYWGPHVSLLDPQAVMRRLLALGLSTSLALHVVVLLLLRAGKPKDVHALWSLYESHFNTSKLLDQMPQAVVLSKDAEAIVKLLQEFVLRKQETSFDLIGHILTEALHLKRPKLRTEHLIEIVKAFNAVGITISQYAADMILNHLKNHNTSSEILNEIYRIMSSVVDKDLILKSPDSGPEPIPHPRDMSLEDLECHLVELQSKGLNTRGVLRRLLQMHCQQGNVKSALEIKEEFDRAGHEYSAGMYAALFGLYIKAEDVDSAKSCLMELSRLAPGFVLDDFKIVDYATLLVKNGGYRGALCALEGHAGSRQVRGGKALVRNCWRLLQALAERGEPDQVRHALHLLQQLGYCALSNMLLGPLLRSHLVRGDLSAATKEYQRCAVEHRCTPLQLELMCHILQAKASDSLLEDVVKATESVHGSASTYAALAVALAQTGNRSRLEKLLLQKKSVIKQSILMLQCKRLAEEGKLTPLEILAGACESVLFMDTSALYMLMLQVYDDRGEYNGALALWTTMQEKSIQPSNKFLQTLASLLKKNKQNVPFADPPH